MTSPYYLRKKSQNRLLHRTDELIPLGGKDGVASKGMRTPRLLTTNRLKSSTKLKHDSLGQRSERLFLGRQVEYDRTNAVKEKERSERCIRIVGDGDRSLSYHLSSELDSSDESEPSETSVMSRSRWNDFSFPGSEDMLLIKDMRTSGAEGETKANSSQLDDEWEKSESSLPESSSQEEIYVTTIAERAKKSHRKKTEPIVPHKEQRRSKSSKSRKSRSCEFGKKSDAERKSERLTPVADFDKVFLLDLAENTSVFDAEYDPDLLVYLRKKFLKEISVKRKISYSSTRAKDTDIPDKNLSNKRSSTKPRSGKRKSSSHVSKRKKALHSDDVTAQSEGISWERDLRKRGLIAKKKTNLPKSTNSEELNTSKTGGIPQNPDVKPVLACIPGPVLDQNVANTERKERQLEETVSDLVKKSKVGNSDAVSTGITLPSSGKELDSTLRQLLNPDDPRAVRSTRYDGHDRGILENVDDEFCKALIQGEKEQNSIDSGIKLTVISDQSGASDSLGEANVSQTDHGFPAELIMEVTAEFSDASSTVSAGRTEITCRLCRNHGIRSLMKSHRGCCPYESCLCSQCLQVLKKRMKSKTQRRDKGTSYEQGGTDLLNPLFPQSEKPNVSSDAASQGSCINGSQDSADISSNRLIQKPREATVKCENLQSSTISTNRRVGGMLGFDHVKSEATENTAVNLEGLPQSGKQTNVKAEVVATSSKTQHRFETVSQKSSACSAVASSSRAQAGLGDVSERFPASLNKQKGSQSIVSVPTTSASCLGQLLTAGHSQNGNSIFRNNLNNGFPSIPYSYNVTRETESTQKLRPHLIDSVGNYQSSWYQQRVREGWIASHYPLYSQTGRTPLFGSGSWPNSSQFGHSNGNCFPPPYFNSSRFQTVSMNDITAWNQQARFPRNIMTIPQHYYAQIPRFS